MSACCVALALPAACKLGDMSELLPAIHMLMLSTVDEPLVLNHLLTAVTI